MYTDVFGGANIYPSTVDYSALTLTADVTLSWPEETSASSDLATSIIDLSAALAGWSVYLPAANKSGTGQTILFNNVGAESVTVRNAGGTQVVVVTPGTLWQIYISDNSSANGIWKSLQYGATSSVADASALAGTGIVAVGTLLSQSVPITTFNSDYTAGDADRAKMFVWTGAGGTFTLPSSVAGNWFCYFRNSGSGTVVVDPTGAPTIDGQASLSFQPDESAIISTDGSNFYTIGFGQSATFAFDYTSMSVAGTGNYTLSGVELNRIAYRFTGILTGNRNIIVPLTIQQYWVDNSTTGAFTLTVKPAAGTGVAPPQGSRAILYCDGTNVVDASTASLAVPVTIVQGGTGATSASGARINLGATAVGAALFTAVSAAAAYGTLGVAPTGVVDGGAF